VGFEPTAFWLWARWLATCLRCDKADPPAGLAPAFCPLPTDRSAISAWMEWKWDTHPGLAPGKIGFADRRLVDFALCVNETGQVRGTCTHPAGFTGLNAAGYIIT
jgi:hypothetical protein